MNTYIQTFEKTGLSSNLVVTEANAWADEHNEEIVSANLTIHKKEFYTDFYLTVVFRKNG